MEDDLPSDEDQDAFYAAIGRAITAWAEVEEILFAGVHAVLGCAREKAAVCFYRTPSLEARISLAHDLFQTHWPEGSDGPEGKEWGRLQKEMRKHLSVRNRLAHHQVGMVVDMLDIGDDIIVPVTEQAIYPAHGERLRKRLEGMGEMRMAEITAHVVTVARIANELRNFRLMYMSSDLERRPEEVMKPFG